MKKSSGSGRIRCHREQDLEKSVAVGWLEFGSHEEVLHCEGCGTRHIAMVQEPPVHSFFQVFH